MFSGVLLVQRLVQVLQMQHLQGIHTCGEEVSQARLLDPWVQLGEGLGDEQLLGVEDRAATATPKGVQTLSRPHPSIYRGPWQASRSEAH